MAKQGGALGTPPLLQLITDMLHRAAAAEDSDEPEGSSQGSVGDLLQLLLPDILLVEDLASFFWETTQREEQSCQE